MNRLILKHPKGWFAAGREFTQALTLLSDGAFKLYVYISLRADRHNGRLCVQPGELAKVLARDQETIARQFAELQNCGVCHVDRSNSDTVTLLEICDRFWPYRKPKTIGSPHAAQAEFAQKVRDLFLAHACVQSTFSAADEKIAFQFYRRGLSLEQVRRAILLGCARKYVAGINHQVQLPITSLQYFVGIIDEVIEPTIPDSYWEPLRHKVEKMERSWLESSNKKEMKLR